MTPEELEALADRVEAGAATNAEIACAIRWSPSSLRDWMRGGVIDGSLHLRPTSDDWFGVYRAGESAPLDAFQSALWLSSLDAAAQVMPAGWHIDLHRWEHRTSVLACRKGCVMAIAPTECAARVAAGLRARAHVLRNGGAA